ncbi:MAG: plastocyanin/azurin family copper-binding protein [Chloroflexota bacterium]|nr:plastocyanin/azurin family copper-binding protein [Chloroflexota bacterium]
MRVLASRLATSLALAVTAIAVAACAASSGASSAPVATDHVNLPKSYRFDPANITVSAGTTVTWTNNDDFSHSVRLLDDDGASSGEPLVMEPGESVEFTFDHAGTFRYDCSFHPRDMQGTVTVTE